MTAWPICSLSTSSSSWTARRIASALPNKKSDVVASTVSEGIGTGDKPARFPEERDDDAVLPVQVQATERFSRCLALGHDRDIDQPEIFFREFLAIDGETVKAGDGGLRISARVEDCMPGEDTPGHLLGGEHVPRPGIPQVPVKGDLVDNRDDPGRRERPYPEDDACRRPLVLADDHKIRVFDPGLLPCLGVVIIPPYHKRPPAVFEGKFACRFLILFDYEHLFFREGKALYQCAGQLAIPDDHRVVEKGMGCPANRAERSTATR